MEPASGIGCDDTDKYAGKKGGRLKTPHRSSWSAAGSTSETTLCLPEKKYCKTPVESKHKMLKIDITKEDGISPHLQATLADLKNTRPLMRKLGEGLVTDIRAHFAARDQEPNARGWPKAHFWARAGRRNTALNFYNDTEAVVSIASEAIAHKLEGGEVRPKRGRALAIPNSAEAYKAGQPSSMNKDMLEFIPLNMGGLVGMLVERQHDVLRKTKKGFKQGEKRGGKIWYWLMAKVTHKPDPRTLPPDDEIEARVYSAADNYLQQIFAAS